MFFSKCYLMNLARISSLRADSVAFEELSRASCGRTRVRLKEREGKGMLRSLVISRKALFGVAVFRFNR